MSRTPQKDQPLQVEVIGNRLVISIGIDTLAFAFDHSALAQPYCERRSELVQHYKVTDIRGFAKEVAAALNNEREDGATPMALLLDQAQEDALNDGSLSVEEGVVPMRIR